MTTTDLVKRYLKRIIQSAKEAEKGLNLHLACEDVQSALNGANDTFPALGDRDPSEGWAELKEELMSLPFNENKVFARVISFAIDQIKIKQTYWKPKN